MTDSPSAGTDGPRNRDFAAAGVDPERVERLRTLTRHWVAAGATPALVTRASRHGVVFHHEASGATSPDPDAPPVTDRTVFPLSSLTKPITATAIMILVDDGLIDLNDRVRRYLPDLIESDAVALHHVLTFTTGFDAREVEAYVEAAGDIPVPDPPANAEPARWEMLYRRRSAPLSGAPGSEMAYGGHAYELLAEVVRVVAGETLSAFARRRIFEPLGMSDTAYVPTDELVSRCVDYRRSWIDPQHKPRTEFASSGALSTATDMARFGRMFLDRGASTDGGRRVLSPASIGEMTRNQVPGVGAHYRDEYFPEATWGYGWNLRGRKRQPMRGSLHSPETFFAGGAGGVLLWIDPVYAIVGCFFGIERGRGYEDPEIDESYHYPPALFMNAVTAAAV